MYPIIKYIFKFKNVNSSVDICVFFTSVDFYIS